MTVPAIEVNGESLPSAGTIDGYMDCYDYRKISIFKPKKSERRGSSANRCRLEGDLSRMILASVQAVKSGHRAHADFRCFDWATVGPRD
jgi:hypothetical protein